MKNLYEKARRVAASTQTPEQAAVARRYLELAERRDASCGALKVALDWHETFLTLDGELQNDIPKHGN